MRKTLLYLYSVMLLSMSCNDYLDIVPDNIATLEFAFRDRTRAEQYLFTCYSYMPKNMTAVDPGFTCGDAIYSNPNRSGNFPNIGFDLMYYGNNVNSPYLNYWDGGSGGENLWQGIRDCNIFIENIHDVNDMESFEKNRWAAEAKFLKAYYHFYLMRLYGPIPIVRENLPISASPEEVAVYREPVDDVVEYIVALIDEALEDLPITITNEVSELGRITKPIAMSIKAKILVTAASPMFNGNQNYQSLKDGRDIVLINQAYSADKWQRALLACEEAISVSHQAGHKLYRKENISLDISDSTKQVLLVSQIVTDKWNEEIIWASARYNSLNVEKLTIPPLTQDHRLFSGGGTWAPTMKMAEMFYSENGVPIGEDSEYDYEDRYSLTSVSDSLRYYLQPGKQTAVLHTHREPRFYGALAVDGGWFYGLGRLNDKQQWPVNAKSGEQSGRQGIERFTPTSFYLKKLYNYRSTYSGESYINFRWSIPIMRLADLYLLYAEALNETLDAPNEDVYKYVDLIRERAGLNSVEESWSRYSVYPRKYLSKEGMREIIHTERNIELSFEGQRFWDIRRWKKALEEFTDAPKGWNVDGETVEEFYQIRTLELAPYSLKDILWPIAQRNISVNNNLVQNPGW
ncbi:RagB/SusD family nutrient uptake outer membrane protein [Membranicola marinus]|uniref:RagB/SusD family nutrient uptake outer membrane protein n=1 Tax=Membranihabitans marinus TaxID=1227546 RepID=A0A953HR94_9BACT|nr:RagB/SusD family nutrient uptake outer membrane protein [Membranihabitans marinus]MBY5956930.1 RagB/SusD family nutrient uptake outer membrane protein [Membranihabitans marinus]